LPVRKGIITAYPAPCNNRKFLRDFAGEEEVRAFFRMAREEF
jgi:hypothetical protein